MVIFKILFLHLFTLVVLGAAASQDDCKERKCNPYGPDIRFPFRRNDQQSSHCQGYPGFELSCSGGRDTVLEFEYLIDTSLPGFELSFAVKASVKSINYTSQQIFFSVLETHTTLQPLSQNSAPPSPFKTTVKNEYGENKILDLSFFNCSGRIPRGAIFDESLGHDFRLYTFFSRSFTSMRPLTSCTKMYNVSSVPNSIISRDYGGILNWSRPNCGYCEAKREYCKLKNNRTHDTVCFPVPEGLAFDRVVAGIFGSTPFIIFLLVVPLFHVIYAYKRKKEDQLKIEMFLNDYKALKPTRYSYTDIKKITNHLKEKLGQGGYGSVYKGQLSNEVLVAVKVLNNVDSKGNGEDFINEVSTIGLIHHVNVVRLVGYCGDGSSRALVYEFLPNNSLEKYVCSIKNHKNKFLGWEKMQQIALGIAKGIEYLHQGCAQRILHFDIKPHNVLLDHNFNPKISDFGLAKLCSKEQSIVSMTVARGTIGYIAPEVFSRNFGKVSSKSDVYSFGMLLLEMVGAKNYKAVRTQGTSQTYFPEWIFHHLEQGGEVKIQIEKEVDTKIARKLTIVGLWCIGWHPVDRPSMKRVIQMLKGEACPAIPPNPFSSANSRNASTTGTTNARPFTNELEIISESKVENQVK